MAGAAKVGDHGHGYCYAGHTDVEKGQPKEITTEFLTGSADVFVNGMPCAVLGTIGHASCGHHTLAITGSATVFVNGVAAQRIGDAGIITEDGGGNYDVITASIDVYIG